MLSEGRKLSCDGVLYKTHESQRVRKVSLKQHRQCPPYSRLASTESVDVDVFTHEHLGEGCQTHMLQITLGIWEKINSQIFSS